MIFGGPRIEKLGWLVSAALRGSAVLIFLWVAGFSLPVQAASPITGVTVALTNNKSIVSGDAVYAKATVQGTGDYDHRVTWSLSPNGTTGSISPTGLFIANSSFSGAVTIKATSVENPLISGTANLTVASGSEALHVDRRNGTGIQDGSALHPFRNIQNAIDHAGAGVTIKVAQGIYTDNLTFPWNFGLLLLGGFQGGTAANYAANLPGDFDTRSTDHLTLVTTIQSSSRTQPVVLMETYDPGNPKTYAVDGFTLTAGANAVAASGNGQVDFFISQNLITDNGTLGVGNGGGISAQDLNFFILNNQIAANQADNAGGLMISTNNPFLIQGNIIENNSCNSEFGGGVWMYPGPGLFTVNILRGNRCGVGLSYGYGGGLCASSTQLELNRNVYYDNQAVNLGGAIFLDGTVVLRHELIYKNRTSDEPGAAGVCLASPASVTLEHCTITGNTSVGTLGNGLFLREETAAAVSNSIIRGNSGGEVFAYNVSTLNMTYSNSQDYPGTGNIAANPLFANPDNDDYHLKSRRGRWNPATSRWVRDGLHSPCIDAGNPASPFGLEPLPNGGRTNMGVYGDTPEASKSQEDSLSGLLELLLGG